MRAAALLCVASAAAEILHVGPKQRFTTPCQALRSAPPGATIEIEPGDYRGDVCGINAPNLTIRGIGGRRPHIQAAGRSYDAKGIWVLESNAANTTIENIEFSGAAVADRNGAGIRVSEGLGVTIRNCHFHDNETGILTAPAPNADVRIEYSIFENNGYGDGLSHNVYVHRARRLIFRGNYSRRANVGQLLKTRARENWIVANRLTQEDGAGSKEIDIAEGGEAYVLGNIIQQGIQSEHRSMLAYVTETPNPHYPHHHLLVLNNTLINQALDGTFVSIGQGVTEPVELVNNVFVGPGVWCSQRTASFRRNLGAIRGIGFGSLQAGTQAIDYGEANPSIPPVQYRHPACLEIRVLKGNPDAGAYEFGGGGALQDAPARCR
ncbi:MAG: right-handed parallel beta-helix repeat-containing protein [Bryobacterales bacterium]|nr:right-handed parallel beta-helix repeat-containing protein [Bryobacterales bacterium]